MSSFDREKFYQRIGVKITEVQEEQEFEMVE